MYANDLGDQIDGREKVLLSWSFRLVSDKRIGAVSHKSEKKH